MVYINSWQKYQEAAENLYANAPRKVRYTLSRSFLAIKRKPSFSAELMWIVEKKGSLQRKMEIFGGQTRPQDHRRRDSACLSQSLPPSTLVHQ